MFGAVVLIGAALAAFTGPFGLFKADPFSVGTVVSEKPSPDGKTLATVTAAIEPGHYILAFKRDNQTIASREVSAPIGYHTHVVSVAWVPDGSRAIVTIDYDFGDAVRAALVMPRGRRS